VNQLTIAQKRFGIGKTFTVATLLYMLCAQRRFQASIDPSELLIKLCNVDGIPN
jgi:hypothetical protein